MNKAKRISKTYWMLAGCGIPIFLGLINTVFSADLPEGYWGTFYAAVFFSAAIGGLRAGLLATITSLLINVYFFIPPTFTWDIQDMRRLHSLLPFILTSLLMCGVFEQLRRTSDQIQKLNVNEIEINLRRLTESLQATNTGLWEWNVRSNQLLWTDTLYRLYGLDPQQHTASHELWISTLAEEDRANARHLLETALETGCEMHFEWKLVTPYTEQQSWLRVLGKPEFGADGELSMYRGVVTAVTEHKLALESLRQSENRMRLATETTGVGIWQWNLISQSVQWDTQMFRIYGIEPTPSGHVQYTTWSERVFLEDLPIQEAILKDTIQNLGHSVREFRIRRADSGECRYIQAMETVRTNALGRVEWLLGTNLDITERKIQETELRQHREQLENLVYIRTEELNQARLQAEHLSSVKSRFLSNMSHEIRTPMNAVLGFGYLLEQLPLNAEARSLVNKINTAGHSLLALINDILDLSKIEVGHLEIEAVSFQLDEMLDHLAAMMSSLACHKELELSIMPPELPNALFGDKVRLQQVLVNLLSNAIKFTDRGSVELKVNVVEALGDNVKIRFAVRDTGIGIASDQYQDLFTAFTQADTSINRRFGGTGLGLTISQQLVRLMGGELQLHSNLGEGSEFWFVLSLKRSTETEYNPGTLSKLNLLIVDDSKIARDALLMTARSLGWSAQAVVSGAEAIRRVRECGANGKCYDVVLLDWKMPDMDGLETARILRGVMLEHCAHANYMPMLLMFTAHTHQELKSKALENSIDAVLSKPISPSTLYNSVASLLVLSEHSEQIEARPSIQQLEMSGIKVLVVDDSDINREVAQRILEAHDALVYLADNGKKAVDWLVDSGIDVDIILMDIQMPVMDGYVATRILRQNPRFVDLPIIAVTAGAFTTLRDDALAAGMNDFIAKPFNVLQFLEIIRFWTQPGLANNTAQSPEPVKAQLPLVVDLPESDAALWPGIEWDDALKSWGSLEVYLQYLAHFVSEYHQAAAQIRQYESDNLQQAASMLAHKLKGAALSLRLTSVTSSAKEVEARLAGGESVTVATFALQEAIEEITVVLATSRAPQAECENIAASPVPELAYASEFESLSNDLLTALSDNNPLKAESLLKRLEALLGAEDLAPIKRQIEDFNFRAAKHLTELLVQKSKLSEEG